MGTPLRLYFVIGEMSGDALGADLMAAFKERGTKIEPLGLGGAKMRACGLVPLFPSDEISVMGISAIIARLPGLLARVRRVADDIIEQAPDAVLLVDSPEFAKLVAKRVKRARPNIPIIKYVAPTVWAWRPGRAVKMRGYVDHVLAILPFEPALLKALGGPPATYVGHPLSRFAGKTDLSKKRRPADPPTVLLMPGSRRSEVARLLPVLGQTVAFLESRGHRPDYLLPAVDHLADSICKETEAWKVQPKLLRDEAEKFAAMRKADLAIAASGTAILELAMQGVPTISIYKLDPALNAVRFLIKAWTAALPNLIADQVIVPERINEFAHPGYIGRLAEGLMREGPERDAQLAGFEIVHQRMGQDRPSGELAAETILRQLGRLPAG